MTPDRCCGDCQNYSPENCYDLDGYENTVAIGICHALDHIVWFDTPTEDCAYWEERGRL